MTDEEVRAIKPGLYLIWWEDGSFSYAAIGCTANGKKWLAPINWLAPYIPGISLPYNWWRGVDHIEPVIPTEPDKKEETPMEKFWMVYGGYCDTPARRHQTEEEARKEAERLAHKHPGLRFYVLEAVASCRASGIEWRE